MALGRLVPLLLVVATLSLGLRCVRPILFALDSFPHSVAGDSTTQLTISVDASGRAMIGGKNEYAVDQDGDGTLDLEFAFPSLGTAALAWEPSGLLAGLRCQDVPDAPRCAVEHVVDLDQDLELEDSEAVLVDNVLVAHRGMLSASLAYDASGLAVLAWVANSLSQTQVKIARDLDADGLFVTPGELVTLESVDDTSQHSRAAGRVAVDPDGNVAYAYRVILGGLNVVRVAYDRSGDDEFDDTVGGVPEIATVLSTGGTFQANCLGTSFDPLGRLAVSTAGVLWRDLNGNGDLTEPGEQLSSASGICDLASGSVFVVVRVVQVPQAGEAIGILQDRNHDGDFDDETEDLRLVLEDPSRIAATVSPDGRLHIATTNQIGSGGNHHHVRL